MNVFSTVDSDTGLVPCVNSTCYGLNAKFNVISAARGLLESLLDNAPPFVQHEVEDIVGLSSQGKIQANELRERLQQLMFFTFKHN